MTSKDLSVELHQVVDVEVLTRHYREAVLNKL